MKISLHLLLCLLPAASAPALTLDLRPDGPIASLAAARDAAREARAAGGKGPITVRVADGIYPITEPVVFEPRDSGASYEAVPGAHPVFTGGRKIGGFTVGADGRWTARLQPGTRFEALWVNGQRAVRARTPNEGYFAATGSASAALPGVPLAGEPAKTMLKIAPSDAELLRGLNADELRDVNVVVYHSWNETRHRIAGVRIEDGTLQFTGGSRAFFSLEPFHRLHFENLRNALDAPGEWFLGRDGILSYLPRPGEKPETADVQAPVAPQWLLLRGDPARDETLVRDLHFRGLGFRFQSYTLPPEGVGFHQAEALLGAAIEADGLREVSFEQCEFAHTMTNVVWLHRGCRDVMVRQCNLQDLGGGGVKIGDPKLFGERDQTSRITVDNCIIQTGGRYFLSAIGVLTFHASDCTITHCDIADFFYSAISIGWTWGYQPTPCARNLVEHCHLHHLGWGVLSDMGAVYTLGPQPGTVIRGCHIHDIGCASYGGWGMYNDEGSSGIVWENNLVHHTQDAGYHMHYGRDVVVRNNIIAFGAEELLRRSRPEKFHAFTIEKNILLPGPGKLLAHLDKNWFDGNVTFDRNDYWKPGGGPISFAGKSFAEWQATGNDRHSVIADPLFVDVASGDWTLKPESPALQLGFIPFDWKQAGVTGAAGWRRLASREFPPMIFGSKPVPPPLSLRDDFEQTSPGSPPARAHTTKQLRFPVVVVAQPGSKGAHCLQLTDGPEAVPSFEPYFFYSPNHAQGTTRVAFDIKCEPDYRLVHEWRDDAQPYRTGPMLTFEDGAISVPGRRLADLPPNEWVHVEITARLGPESDGTYAVALTLPGREAQRFAGLKFLNDLRVLNWVGFASPGKVEAKCWLDEMVLENK